MMYLCTLNDVASVSQLGSFPLITYYMGCCEDYLSCDIAFNAVMPLSRASTRRRYSRIEGVTVCILHFSSQPNWAKPISLFCFSMFPTQPLILYIFSSPWAWPKWPISPNQRTPLLLVRSQLTGDEISTATYVHT